MAATLTAPRAEATSPEVESRPPSRPPARRRPMRTSSLVAWSLTGAGLVVLGFVAFLLVGSRVQATRAQDLLYDDISSQLGDATAPMSGTIDAGTPIGVLEIPRLGLREVLLQGSTSAQTAVAPGLTSDSAFPGESGLSLVVGRRATFGADFQHLDRLRIGDQIVVTTGLGRTVFSVDLARHSDDPATTIPVAASRLTLVTSDPAFTPTRQVVVSAALSGNPFPTSTTPVGREGERPGEHSLDNAVVVLLWTQLLLALVWVVTRAGLRFPRRAVWIGAVPVLLAVLWHVFEGLAVLLPNTL